MTSPVLLPGASQHQEKVKVGIIGSGLAGLTAAHLLSNPPEGGVEDVEYEVHVFEKAPMLGMDSASVTVPRPTGPPTTNPTTEQTRSDDENGSEWRIDVPMRSFQGGYYPQLIALYEKLGVSFHVADFSYSFSFLTPSTTANGQQKRSITTTLIYNGASGRKGLGMPSILKRPYEELVASAKSSELEESEHGAIPLTVLLTTKSYTIGTFILVTFYIVICYIRMMFFALPVSRHIPLLLLRLPSLPSLFFSHQNSKPHAPFEGRSLSTMTFGEWAELTEPTGFLARWTGFDTSWRDYTRTVLVPLFSAVCTAPEEDVLKHPVEEFLDYIWLTFGTHHYVVDHGVRDVVNRLSSNLEHIHVGVTITSINHDSSSNQATIEYTTYTANGDLEAHSLAGFDHIIIATQASRAVPLLQSYHSSLNSVLESASSSPSSSRSPSNHSHSMQRKKQILEDQIRCLGKFEYRETLVVNHTDNTLMPYDKRDRRDLNLICVDPEEREREGYPTFLDKGFSRPTPSPHGKREEEETDAGVDSRTRLCLPSTYAMATHILPRPEGYTGYAVYQTTNPIIPPREDTVLSAARLERAMLTLEGKEALKELYTEDRRWWQIAGQGNMKLGRLQGAGCDGEDGSAVGPGIWICGSFAYAGIPLLEGCVVSARNVVEQGIRAREGSRSKQRK